MMDLYYAIVGTTTDTNVGLARFMGVILVFIMLIGTLFWAIG
jgi:cbb3-type cytochrome oxidase subunit 3